MLTAAQMETVAYSDPEGDLWLCPPCARERYAPITVARVDLGLNVGVQLEPMGRWALDDEWAELNADDPEQYPDDERLSCGWCGDPLDHLRDDG